MMIKYWHIVTLVFKKGDEVSIHNHFPLGKDENESLEIALANSTNLIKQGYLLASHCSEKLGTQVCPSNINGVRVKD